MASKDELIDSFFTRHVVDDSLVRAELHGIWESGYQEGLLDNEEKIKEEGNRQYNHGYANGVVAGKEMVLPGVDIYQEGYQEGYDKGADDARYELWWAIKKLYLNPSEDGLLPSEICEIFGEYHIINDILQNFTPEEVIEKVKSYEESKKSALTNKDKFKEDFSFIAGEILHTSLNGVRGFFVTDDWANRAYEEK